MQADVEDKEFHCRYAKARDILHARSLGPRTDFKGLQPRTARRFKSSGIWKLPPDCWAGGLMSKNGEKTFKI